MTYRIQFVVSFFALLFFSSCAHHKSQKPQNLDGVKTYHHLGFAGDQEGVDFRRYKDAGYKKIVNLREVGEEGYSKEDFEKERSQAKKLGLEYINAPFYKSQIKNKKIETAVMQNIEDSVNPNQKEKVTTLVHCSSATRASAWMMWHMNRIHSKSVEESRDIAYEMSPKDENVDKAFKVMESHLKSLE